MGRFLVHHAGRHGRPVYLVADEPYRHLVYDGAQVPSIFAAYPNTLLATSFSKDLSIPGERLGYVAVSPRAAGRGELEGALVLANRILGFVNAPALMQRVVAGLTDVSLDITPYARRRELFCDVLSQAGYKFLKPQGAFYLFPKAPGGMIWRPWPASRRKISWRCRGGALAGPVISAWPFAWRRRSLRPRPRGLPGPGKRCWDKGE